MPTGYTYASYQAAIVTQIPTLSSDPNFVTMLPDAIDYAELSICRDLDFLAMHGDVDLGPILAGGSTADVPSSVVVIEELFYNPYPAGGPLVPIPPMSQAAIRAIYATAAAGPPEYFAVVGASAPGAWAGAAKVLIGPAADQGYDLTAYATERPTTLSATNTTTFISTNLPDLFWAASMIFWSGYTKNFGQMSDDPRMSVSWESEYARLLKGADREEVRKKFLSQEATAKMPQARVQGA